MARLRISDHLRVGFLLTILILVSPNGYATSQRMFMPPQAFTIGASKSAFAKTMCLDFGISTPRATTSFQPATGNLANVRVTISGRGEMSLADAIAAKIISVSGTGDAQQIEFRNLLPTEEVSVRVADSSLMLPDDNRSSADLSAFFAHSSSVSRVGQVDLWAARATEAMSRLGMNPAEVPRGYVLNPDWLSGTQEWVRTHVASPNGRFVLQRVLPIDHVTGTSMHHDPTAEPLYILYSGRTAPIVFKGNAALIDASTAIKQLWSNGGGTPPPRVLMRGNGRDQDFDSARLTLEAAAGGGGRGNLTGPGRQDSFIFDPPGGSEPPGGNDIYDGGSWSSIRVARRQDDTISSRQAFYKRGFVTVLGKTLSLVCQMAVAVRDAIRDVPPDAPREAAVGFLREVIANEVNEERSRNKTSLVASEEPAAEFNIDGKVSRAVFHKQVVSDAVKTAPYILPLAAAN